MEVVWGGEEGELTMIKYIYIPQDGCNDVTAMYCKHMVIKIFKHIIKISVSGFIGCRNWIYLL